MRWNLAVDYGLDAADEFLRIYRSLAASRGDDQPYWDVVTLLDVVGEDWEQAEYHGRLETSRFERYREGLLRKLG